MFDPLAWWGRIEPSRVALIESASGARHSYGSLDAEAARWARLLRGQGIVRGDRVAVLAANRVEFIPLFYGCARLGAILVPLNWRLSAGELGRVLGDAGPALIVGEERLRAVANEAAILAGISDPHRSGGADLRWLDFDRDVPALLQGTSSGPAGAPGSPELGGVEDDTAMLLYTSGSTGAPKGVMITHRQILFNAIATTTAWGLGPDDVGPAATPFFHTGGWHVFTVPLLFRGGTVVLVEAFHADTHLSMLQRHGVTVTFGVPTHLAMLRESPEWGMPLPKLRWFISGGAPCPQRIRRGVREAGYRFREGYGLTECGPNCFATSDDTATSKEGTVGWPVPFLEMRLRSPDGSDTGANEPGELQLRGPQVFAGYFRAPDKTAEAFTDDGWLRTGDLASRDVDGVYTIRGRRKEMFISGGENVFPGEVEAALLDCPGVADVCVMGVPDARWGEVGCALVVRRDEALLADALLAHARSRLAGYKVPKRVQFVDAIPRLGSGKVDRASLAPMLEAL
jgi:fatty-acyl-CoA synthase